MHAYSHLPYAMSPRARFILTMLLSLVGALLFTTHAAAQSNKTTTKWALEVRGEYVSDFPGAKVHHHVSYTYQLAFPRQWRGEIAAEATIQAIGEIIQDSGIQMRVTQEWHVKLQGQRHRRSLLLEEVVPNQKAHATTEVNGSSLGDVEVDLAGWQRPGFEMKLRDGEKHRGPFTFATPNMTIEGSATYTLRALDPRHITFESKDLEDAWNEMRDVSTAADLLVDDLEDRAVKINVRAPLASERQEIKDNGSGTRPTGPHRFDIIIDPGAAADVLRKEHLGMCLPGVLAHEMAHAHLHDADPKSGKVLKGSASEAYAKMIENDVRRSLGLAPRR